MDSLNLTTAGSVDDGKSTLIGRLLLDSGSLPKDQRAAANGESPLAWLTDGLKAERVQGITIDVAYRYFGTERRRFVIADAPGHFEYTRNMVTAASTCQVALLLVDARHGITEQTCRHAFLSSLLGLRNLILCVNKMDLVDWSEAVYEEICERFLAFVARLDFASINSFPISALHGDNVAHSSAHSPWYKGPALLTYLETVHVGASNLIDARFPVQAVHRADDAASRRFCVGRMASGVFRPGDEVVVLPSGFQTRIAQLATHDGPLEYAVAYQSVALALDEDLEVSRGDMIVRPNNRPTVAQTFDAMICWFSNTAALDLQTRYELKHTSRMVQAMVTDLRYTVDVQTLSRTRPDRVTVNDIARVSVHTSEPLMFDPYSRNRVTGSFVLLDPVNHETVAAGMIR